LRFEFVLAIFAVTMQLLSVPDNSTVSTLDLKCLATLCSICYIVVKTMNVCFSVHKMLCWTCC